MKKRKVHESTFEPRKKPSIHHLNSGGKLETSAAIPIKELEKPCCEPHHTYGMLCANIALDYYNTKNDTNFTLVMDNPFKCIPLIGSYDTLIHCFFKAMDDSSIKLLSAELKYVYHLGLNVTNCKVSEGDDVDLFDEDKNSADEHSSLNPDTPEYTSDSPNYDPDASVEARCFRKARIAKRAIKHYNKEHGTKYELVQNDATMKISPFSDTLGNWFRCCFEGVDHSIQQDISPHLFFAEVEYNYPSEPVVYLCKKLTEGNVATTRCEHCYSDIKHPASGDDKCLRELSNRQKDKNISPCTVVAHPYDYWDYFGSYEDPRKETQTVEQHCSRACRIFDILFANIALDIYNTTNDSNFILVEDASLTTAPVIESSGIWILSRFIAKQSSSIKRFSADLIYAHSSGLTLTNCNVSKILENDEEDRKHEIDYAGEVKGIADKSSATTPQEEESSLRYNSLLEAEKVDVIHHHSPGGKDKNDPGLKTPAAITIEEHEKPCCEPHHTYGMLCANIALDYYNKKNVKNFTLVADEPFNCSPIMGSYDTSWIHCFFKAKDDYSSIMAFFAELKYVYHLGLNVNICKVLEGDDVDLFDEDKNSADEHSSLNPDTPEFTSVYLTYDPKAFEEVRCFRKARIAKRAIKHYNKENGAEYKIVQKDDSMEISPFSDTFGKWFHCCFEGVDPSTQEDDNSPHLFFAGAEYNYPSEPVVYLCKKLTEGNIATTPCEHCYSYIKHPAGVDDKCLRELSNLQKDKNKSPCTVVAHPYDYWDYFGSYEDPRKKTQTNEQHCSRARRIFDILFANIALDIYNTTINDSNFILVEDGSLNTEPSIQSSQIWIHFNFIAKQRSSINRFSADLIYDHYSSPTLTNCKVSKVLENDEEDYAGEVGIADKGLATTPEQEELSLRYNK